MQDDYPVYSYATDYDGIVWSEEYVKVRQVEAVYAEPVIEVSVPDENGNVTYTVTYEMAGTWKGDFNSYVDFWDNITFKNFYFVDAYTGTVFPDADLTGEVSEYLFETDISIDDTTYHISNGKSMTGNWNNAEWSGNSYQEDYTVYMTLTAVVPAEYDGLILAISENGMTEYSEYNTEIKEAKPFDTAEIATTIFKNVNYEGNLVK